MKSEKRIFYRKLMGLVFPIAVQNLMTALVSASDAFMLGFVSQTSLSAVSLATQVQFVHNLFMLTLTWICRISSNGNCGCGPGYYFIISMDEVIKVPAVYRHYKKYKWVKNLTEDNSDDGLSGSVSEG